MNNNNINNMLLKKLDEAQGRSNAVELKRISEKLVKIRANEESHSSVNFRRIGGVVLAE